jgi:hypothetical protein
LRRLSTWQAFRNKFSPEASINLPDLLLQQDPLSPIPRIQKYHNKRATYGEQGKLEITKRLTIYVTIAENPSVQHTLTFARKGQKSNSIS